MLEVIDMICFSPVQIILQRTSAFSCEKWTWNKAHKTCLRHRDSTSCKSISGVSILVQDSLCILQVEVRRFPYQDAYRTADYVHLALCGTESNGMNYNILEPLFIIVTTIIVFIIFKDHTERLNLHSFCLGQSTKYWWGADIRIS